MEYAPVREASLRMTQLIWTEWLGIRGQKEVEASVRCQQLPEHFLLGAPLLPTYLTNRQRLRTSQYIAEESDEDCQSESLRGGVLYTQKGTGACAQARASHGRQGYRGH
jgi:hypothetical protein